jgi:hypothetical protein
LRARFYIDPATDLPHIYGHGVSGEEVIDVLERPGEDRNGFEGSRVALGQTGSGRFLRVIYVPDPEPNSVFVITAYDLAGKALKLTGSEEGRSSNEQIKIP